MKRVDDNELLSSSETSKEIERKIQENFLFAIEVLNLSVYFMIIFSNDGILYKSDDICKNKTVTSEKENKN